MRGDFLGSKSSMTGSSPGYCYKNLKLVLALAIHKESLTLSDYLLTKLKYIWTLEYQFLTNNNATQKLNTISTVILYNA